MNNLPITNIEKFVPTTMLRVNIPNNFEVLYRSSTDLTHHHTNYGYHNEGITLHWDGDVFNIKDNVYIRELK